MPLCAPTGGRSSSTLRPNRATRPSCRARSRRLEHGQRLRLVLGAAVVEGDGERLPLDVVPVDVDGEGLEPLAPRQRLGLELEAVLADVDELVEADDAARIGARAAADAGDERVAAVQPASSSRVASGTRPRAARRRSARGRRRRRAGSPPRSGRLGERASRSVAVHAPRIRAVALKLVLIGLVAGLFSALFGVGGGIVIVPLLILAARVLESRSRRRPRSRRSGSRRSPARSSTPSRATSTSPTPPWSACPQPPERRRDARSSASRAGARSRSPAPRRAIAVWLLVG